MRIESKIASALYHARTKAGWTQRQVAEAVSISERWYQRIERGEKLPGTLTMLRLFLLLHIDIEDFRDALGLLPPPKR